MKDEGIESIRNSIKQVIEKENIKEKDKDDPCWDGYEQYGTKTDEDGNEVPNCVPIKKESRDHLQSLKESISQVYEAEKKEDDDKEDSDDEKKDDKEKSGEKEKQPEHNLEVTPRIHKGLEDADKVENVKYKDEDGDDCLYFEYNGVKYKVEVEMIDEGSEESDE